MSGFEGVEFTDRYGGRHVSWLTSCHACDAMGCYPDWVGEVTPDGKMVIGGVNNDDNWDFVVCGSCKGTAKVAWYWVVSRLPKWFWRNSVFVLHVTRNREMHWPDTTLWERFKLGMQCSYLSDLGLWKP